MTRYMLTTRLVREVCYCEGHPFASATTLFRRLDKLREAGFIHRDRMLVTGEFYYHLSKGGAKIVEYEYGIEMPRRACFPIKPLLQSHEFDLSRYWIKFFDDCRKLNIPIIRFWRDGQFVFHHRDRKLIPDGVVILRIRGKAQVFFVEMDRSTQTSGVGGQEKAVIRQKLEQYRSLSRNLYQQGELSPYRVKSMRLMMVCKTEARLKNLCTVAHDMGIKQCAFTCWPRLIEVKNPNTAYGWNYRTANMLAAPLYSFPSRSPPGSLLSR